MNELCKVAICVPVYDVEKYIVRCVKSLFEQSYENIEYIFVNDCTKDRSIELLTNELNNYPRRKSQVKIINHKKNSGLGAARNTAVKNCTAPFIIHVDSDDWLDPDCIQLCVEKQKETNADIISFGMRKIYMNKHTDIFVPDYAGSQELVLALIRHEIPNGVWGRFIRRSLYVDNNISVTDGVNMSEDLNVIPRLAYRAKKISVLPKILYFYNCINQASYTSSFSEEKTSQEMITINVLQDFFCDKGKVFMDAIELREYNMLINNMINSAKEKGHYPFYLFMRQRIDHMPKYLQSTLSLPKRLAFFIRNYGLFVCYVRLASFVKKLIK